MNKEDTNRAKRSRLGACVAVALLLIALVATGLKIYNEDSVPTGDSDFGLFTDSASTLEVDSPPPTNRKARGVLVSRAAKGRVPAPTDLSAWGLLIAEGIVGAPRPGDVAYLARLGPDHGLMKVESVEGNRAILAIDTLDRGLIREGDRVETMPPLIQGPHE